MIDAGYLGKVKVSLMKGNKIINTQTYKNNGRWPLFYYLTNCLAGSVLDNYRPKYIRLWHAGAEGENVPSYDDTSVTKGFGFKYDGDKGTCLSLVPIIYSGSLGVSEPEKLENSRCYTTLKFVVPYTQVQTDSDITMLALYCGSELNETDTGSGDFYNQPSAYCFLTNPNDSTKLKKLAAIDTQDVNQYNIMIEWQLVITNYEKEN